MKSCPACNRTFEETFTFCLIDGSVLSAPFDPATKPPEQSAPPRTEVFGAPAESKPLPETRLASPQANLQPTITSRFQPQPIVQPYQTPAVLESADAATNLPELARLMFLVRGIAAILFGLLLILLGKAFLLGPLMSAYLLVDGICAIIAGRNVHSASKRGRLLIADGVFRFVVFLLVLVAFRFPFVIFATALVVAGIIEIAAAVSLQKHLNGSLFFGLSGAVSILFFPFLIVANFVTATGGYLIIFGALLLAFGFLMRGSVRTTS